MTTYILSQTLSSKLGIAFEENEYLSDQYILSMTSEYEGNYVPHGGGAAGNKNGHYGYKHSAEAKEKMRIKALGRKAWNKGIPNPEQSKRFLENNPMKNPEISKRVLETRRQNDSWVNHEGCFQKGHKPHNYIDESYKFNCETCGKEHSIRNTAHKKNRRFCNRSCQATFTNKNRTKKL